MRITKIRGEYWLEVIPGFKVRLDVRGAVAHERLRHILENHNSDPHPDVQKMVDEIDEVVAWVAMAGGMGGVAAKIKAVADKYRDEGMVGD